MRAESIRWAVRGAGLAIGAGLVLLLAAVASAAATVLLLVFLAVLLASGLEPLIGWLRARIGIGRIWTILLVYGVFIVVVGVLVLLVAPLAVDQAGALWTALPGFLDALDAWAAGIEADAVSRAVAALTAAGRGFLARPPAPDTEAIVQTGLTVAEVAASVVTLLVVVFFWLVEHARLQRYVLAFVPASRRPGAREAWNRVETRLGLWVRGQLILMGVIGVSTGILYTLVGLPAALLLAVIAAIAEAIPLVGPALGAIPALVVALTVSPETALVVLVLYVVLQFLEGNVLVPIVMRNAVGLSPFLVVVSLLIGAAVGGIVGAFVAVPLIAALEIVLEPLQARDLPVATEPRQEVEDEERSLPDAAAGHAP